MIKHIWSVVCRRATIDRDTNSISLLDCIEQMQVNVPVQKSKIEKGKKLNAPIEFDFVSAWIRENTSKVAEFEMKLELYSPKKKKLIDYSKIFFIPEKKKRLRTRIALKGMPIDLSGEYVFRVTSKEKNREQRKEAEIPFDVVIAYKK